MSVVKRKVSCEEFRFCRCDSTSPGAEINNCVVQLQGPFKRLNRLAIKLAYQRDLCAVRLRECNGRDCRIQFAPRDAQSRRLRAGSLPRDTSLGIVCLSQV